MLDAYLVLGGGDTPTDTMECLREALVGGRAVDDTDFDALYPRNIRRRSEAFWTPVAVAIRAAAMLAPEPGRRVLDVGAGCGKLCCIGALATDSVWHGVERDRDLVAAAYAAALRLRIDHRVDFTVGEMTALDWRKFDAVYLYNPFESAMFVERSEPYHDVARCMAFFREVEVAEMRLAEMPPGTRVVTYHGFGGEMPAAYRLEAREPVGTDFLTLWIKDSHVSRRRRS